MAKKIADDPRFHFDIYAGPAVGRRDRSAIYYVENHNGQCSYAELATDFEMLAWLAIEQFQRDHLGNWTAPIAHSVRQTLELLLKAMLEAIERRGCPPNSALSFSHDLDRIWQHCRQWLSANGYKFAQDARLKQTEWLLAAFHHVDPSGDLFRFGISNTSAFSKQKSYDRVGLDLEILIADFRTAIDFLRHWETVPFREALVIEMGWSDDPHFDKDDFPRVRQAAK